MRPKLNGKLVIATHNAGKLAEMADLLAPYGITALPATDLGLPEPDETGDSFLANAELKARAASRSRPNPCAGRQFGALRRSPRWCSRHQFRALGGAFAGFRRGDGKS